MFEMFNRKTVCDIMQNGNKIQQNIGFEIYFKLIRHGCQSGS